MMEKNLVFGGKCTALSMSYDQESQCWRTCQQSLFVADNKSLDRLPKSGMTQNGLLYQRNNSDHHTKEKGGSVLPTPTASDVKRKMASPSNLQAKDRGYGLCLSAQLTIDKMLPAPTAKLPAIQPHHASAWKRKLQHKNGCQLGVTIAIQTNIPQEQAIGDRLTLNPSFVEWMMGFPEDWTVPD